MHALSWHTIADIQVVEEAELIHHFGKFGRQLFLYAQGIDHRKVQHQRERQQISKEITFEKDYFLNEITEKWQPLIERVWQQLQHKKMYARGVQIKLKTSDFKTLQHSRSFAQPLRNADEFKLAVMQLLQEFNDDSALQFRLIGVGVFALEDASEQVQLSLI